MAKKDKLRVLDRREYISIFDLLDGEDFAGVKFNLDVIEKLVDYGKGETANFVVEPYGYDGGIEAYLMIERDETDAELAKRVAATEKAKEKARLQKQKKEEAARKVLMDTEEKERQEYERLRAKFGE